MTNWYKQLVDAAFRGDIAAAERALRHDADIRTTTAPLDWAARNGHIPMVLYLLEKGANLHHPDSYALIWAAWEGHTDMVRLLIGLGADIHLKDNAALNRSYGKGHREIVALLVGAAGPEAENPYRELRASFQTQVKNLLSLPPEGRTAMLDSPSMREIVAVGLLAEIFTQAAWPEAEGQRHAREFHARLRDGLPKYRQRIDAVDMTAFRMENNASDAFTLRIGAKERQGLETGRR